MSQIGNNEGTTKEHLRNNWSTNSKQFVDNKKEQADTGSLTDSCLGAQFSLHGSNSALKHLHTFVLNYVGTVTLEHGIQRQGRLPVLARARL